MITVVPMIRVVRSAVDRTSLMVSSGMDSLSQTLVGGLDFATEGELLYFLSCLPDGWQEPCGHQSVEEFNGLPLSCTRPMGHGPVGVHASHGRTWIDRDEYDAWFKAEREKRERPTVKSMVGPGIPDGGK